MHSFAAELWDEWTSFPLPDEETGSAELAGLLAALPFKKNENTGTVYLATSRLWSLRRLARLWKNSRWKEEWNVAASLSVPSNMKGRVKLALPLKLYEAAATAAPAEHNWAWARGVWGGCGALYVPRSGYYLVMRTGAEAVARRMSQILNRARVSWSERTRGKREIILREQESIVAFFSKIGLTEASLRLEDKAILRSMRDRANRMRNCDTANINKTLKAAEEQTALAMELLRSGLAPTLQPHFLALLEARLEHPEDSLSDLGRRLSPPVTKSTVKYRWRRLQEFLGTAQAGAREERQ